ncbi:MAG: hypothetical protein RID42_09030 [Alphaproteobacteria bacterium]
MSPYQLDEAEQLSIRNVLYTASGVLKRNILGISILAAITQAVAVAATALVVGGPLEEFGDGAPGLVKGLVDIFGAAFLTAVYAHLSFRDLAGQRLGLGESGPRPGKVFLQALAVGFLVILLVGLGLVFFVIPGVVLMTVLCVALPAAVVERPGIRAALRRSADLTKGNRARIFGLMLVVGIPFEALRLWSVARHDGTDPVFAIESLALAGLEAMSWSLLAAATYFELRRMKEGFGTETPGNAVA